jgi:hypothetical protein
MRLPLPRVHSWGISPGPGAASQLLRVHLLLVFPLPLSLSLPPSSPSRAEEQPKRSGGELATHALDPRLEGLDLRYGGGGGRPPRRLLHPLLLPTAAR